MATASTTPRQIPIVCPGHTRPLAELQFLNPLQEPTNTTDDHDNDTYLLSACHDKMPMIRNATTGDWIGTFSGHKGAVWSTKLDPRGYLAATASGDFSVKVWDGVTGKELLTYPHKHIVKTVDFSGDSKRLATGGHEGLLRVFELVDGPKAVPKEMHQSDSDSDGKVNITKCSWLDNTIVLAAASDGNVRCWNVDTQTQVCKLSIQGSHGAEVRDMEMKTLSNGKIILTVAAGDTVSFFELIRGNDTNGNAELTGTLLHEHKMPIHFREEGGASLHPSGSKFVAGGSDLWVRVFDFASGKELECHRGHHGPIRCLRYSPDGRSYATGSEDGTIRLWKTDPEDGEDDVVVAAEE
jgi:serine-threonine kinase receptor-associated protein